MDVSFIDFSHKTKEPFSVGFTNEKRLKEESILPFSFAGMIQIRFQGLISAPVPACSGRNRRDTPNGNGTRLEKNCVKYTTSQKGCQG